jgi:hypothetical protein
MATQVAGVVMGDLVKVAFCSRFSRSLARRVASIVPLKMPVRKASWRGVEIA